MKIPNDKKIFRQETLDKERMSVLPFFVDIQKKGRYLAGGTGLALQLGHRESIDFDFFNEEDFDPQELFTQLQKIGKDIRITKKERGTLYINAQNIK